MMDLPEKAGEQSMEHAAPLNGMPVNSSIQNVIRHLTKAGVVRPGILHQLAHVKNFSKITSRKHTPPVVNRKRVESFVAAIHKRQPGNKSISADKKAKQPSPDWQKMDLVLPNGSSVVEGQQIDQPSLPFFTPANSPVGQIIPPFEPHSSGESEFGKRMKKAAESPKTEPPSTRKRIAPQSRLYSKVVEIDPRKTAEQPETNIDSSQSFKDPQGTRKPAISKTEPDSKIPPVSKIVTASMKSPEPKVTQASVKPPESGIPKASVMPSESGIPKISSPESNRIQPLRDSNSKPVDMPVSPKNAQPGQSAERLAPQTHIPEVHETLPQSSEKEEKPNGSPVLRSDPALIRRQPETKSSLKPEYKGETLDSLSDKKQIPLIENSLPDLPADNLKADLPLRVKPLQPAKYRISPVRLTKKSFTDSHKDQKQNISKSVRVSGSPEIPPVKSGMKEETHSSEFDHSTKSIPTEEIRTAVFHESKKNESTSSSLNNGDQQVSPDTAHQMTEMPLILKPKIRLVKPLASPVVIKPQSGFPINIIRRLPQTRSTTPRMSAPLDLNVIKPAATPLESVQTAVFHTENPARPVVDTHHIEPVKTKPLVKIQPQAAKQAVIKPAGKQIVQRQYAPSRQAKSVGKPVVNLATPLQTTIRHKTSRPVSMLTAMQAKPTASRKAAPVAVQKQPAKAGTLLKTGVTPLPASTLPVSLILPVAAQAVRLQVHKRELIRQPVLIRQAHTSGQTIQRLIGKLPAIRKPKPIRRTQASGQTIQRVIGKITPPQPPLTRPNNKPPNSNNIVTGPSLPGGQNQMPNQEPGSAGGGYYVPRGQGQAQEPDQNPNDSRQSGGENYYVSQRPVRVPDQKPEPEPKQEPQPASYELRMPEPELAAISNDAEPEVYEMPQPAESVKPDRAVPNTSEPSIQQLAKDVLPIIKKMMALERERASRH